MKEEEDALRARFAGSQKERASGAADASTGGTASGTVKDKGEALPTSHGENRFLALQMPYHARSSLSN